MGRAIERGVRLRRFTVVAGVVALAVLVATVAAFATLNARRPQPAPLAGGVQSPEALGRAVLAGFEAGDLDALRALAVTEEEFRNHVWPGLPVSRPEVNMPFEFVWGQLDQRSTRQLRRALAAGAGLERRDYELVRIQFAGETTAYGDVAVHRDTELVVRDAIGEEQTLRLFGSTIEQDGRFKVFSYVVDE